jgi:hypothetical protein
MTSPHDRDRVDAWLNTEVEPLAPAPGTFGRIRRRARRRKAGRAVMSGAGIVIVIAAAVAAPRIVPTLLHSHNAARRTVAAEPTPPLRRTSPARGRESLNSRPPARITLPSSALTPGGSSGQPVPPNFQPTSVTFVSQATGAVIGQAGTTGHCATAYCTSLAGTSDYGASWYGVSAPLTGPPDGSSGVGQLRFLNARDGWAFGPELWVTHDGGAHWQRERTYGMRVTELETSGGRAFAIFAGCTGNGPAYAADCSSSSLYSSAAESNAWQLVPVPAAGMQRPAGAAGGPGSGGLVLVGTQAGYLLAPSGELLSGPLTGAAWRVASPPVVSRHVRCLPGAAGASGQPAGTLLAASPAELVLVCTSATSRPRDSQAKLLVESKDGGAHWSAVGTAPRAGIATSLAIQSRVNLVVLATDAGIYLSTNGGGSWQLTQPSPGGAAAGEAGFSYVGMTSATNGVALPADASLHEVYVTTDGGGSWVAHPVSSP